jgi:hypothetical protein
MLTGVQPTATFLRLPIISSTLVRGGARESRSLGRAGAGGCGQRGKMIDCVVTASLPGCDTFALLRLLGMSDQEKDVERLRVGRRSRSYTANSVPTRCASRRV